MMWGKRTAAYCVTLLACCGLNAVAGEPQEPTMELLEFLAEFETEDGQWLDPLNFLDGEQEGAARSSKDSSEESHTDD